MSEILLSQLAHVELVSPKPDETVRWMVDVLGLEETARAGQSVYLRGWAEWLHSSLIVTEGPQPAVEHIAWRTYGPDDPETIATRLEGTGQEIGWIEDPSATAGPSVTTPPPGAMCTRSSGRPTCTGAPGEGRGRLPEPPAEVLRPRHGCQVSRPRHRGDTEHRTTTSPSIRHSGNATPPRSMAEPGFTVFATTTCNGIRSTHDLGLVPDFGATGRANHIAYNVDQRLDVERAAEVFMANDTPIEFGPGIHGCDEITYLYVREPGGFRIEINAGGWENAMPDWQATTWNTSQGGTTLWKNLAMPESMMESWPAISGKTAQEATEGFQSTHLFVEN